MRWFHALGGQQQGPYSDEDFCALVRSGAITPDTLVWRDGWDEWKKCGEVGELPTAMAGEPPLIRHDPVGFEFSGRAGEYFKIWIVNLLLTVLTLGIYAAWAKVRNRRYFYANTKLFGHSFNYTGDPVRILIGNLIVFGMALVYFLSGAISPFLVLLVVVIYLGFMPWLVVKSLAFNARNSTWRGMRFGFDGTFGGAAVNYLLFPIAAVFTLYLLFPWVIKEQKKYVVGQHRFGRTRFGFGGIGKDAYVIFGLTLLFFLPLMVAYGFLIATIIGEGIAGGASGAGPGGASPGMIVAGLLFIPTFLSAVVGRYFYQARMFNFVWNNTRIGAHRFKANMRFGGLLGLQIVNAIVVTLTLGFMYPWAKVRVTEFTLNSLRLLPGDNVDNLVSEGAQADESAVGEAAADFFDFDIGLGL